MILELYKNREKHFAEEEKKCRRLNSRYTWVRLLVIISAIALGTVLYNVSLLLSAVTVSVLLVSFAVIIKKHLANIELQHQNERLKTINMQEINCLNGDYSAYQQGNQYEDVKHYYTSDLDIFGAHSLFRYLNRTTSPSGSDMLAGWLCRPAATEDIKERQCAVKELAKMIDLRQKIQATGLKHRDIDKELPDFMNWLHSHAELSGNRRLLYTVQILPWITVAVIVAVISGWVASAFVWIPIAVHFVLYGNMLKRINRLHQQVSRKVEFISTYADLITLVTGTEFISSYLVSTLQCFHKNDAMQQIRALQNRIKRLDYRLNMLYIPVNILFFFDCRHLIWLERWRSGSGQKLPEWFDAIARIEALSSFANVLYNNPSWAMPEIRDEYFYINAKNVGHPLIRENERVYNDFLIDGAGKVAIVTGSNMSGKSTFERSIGVNTVLALAGAPVCADMFAVTNCSLYTYMRIADNLEEHTSSFYAELKRLKQLIDLTGNDEKLFFLLDEVLRGTNSRDRQTGSMALVRQLVRQNVSGIIATHDLALGNLEQELPNNVSNSHFDVQIDNENMSFDYKLYKGICTSLNASILMKKIGIEVI